MSEEDEWLEEIKPENCDDPYDYFREMLAQYRYIVMMLTENRKDNRYSEIEHKSWKKILGYVAGLQANQKNSEEVVE
jgi:hypothetical protein